MLGTVHQTETSLCVGQCSVVFFCFVLKDSSHCCEIAYFIIPKLDSVLLRGGGESRQPR